MTDEPLVAVPIPPLVTVLIALEKEKGSPLTEVEVVRARDQAICIALPLPQAQKMAEARGYDDISLENVWQEWSAFCEKRAAGPNET